MNMNEKNKKYIVIGVIILFSSLYLYLFLLYQNRYEDSVSEYQRKYDSLNIVLSLKKAELEKMNTTYDSVKNESIKQGKTLDSLLAIRKNKRNEKNKQPISSIPDDEINSILSDRLK